MMSQYEPVSDSIERERMVLDTIRQNPNLHHNAIIKLLVPEFMAKGTFEKTRDSLLEKDVISVTIKRNMKFYHPTSNYETKTSQRLEKITTNSFHNLKGIIRKLATDYSHKDVDEKIHNVCLVLKNLLQTDIGFTVMDSAKNPKKTLYRDEHLEIQQLISHVFDIMRNDKDFESVYPSLMGTIGGMLPKDFQDV